MSSLDPVDTSDLARSIRTLAGKLKRRMREQGGGNDLPPSQIAVLVRLDRDGPSTVTALAKAENVRSQSMGATVAALEAAGLVAGAPHPTDGRQTVLSLTPACRRWIDDGRAARQDWLFHTLSERLSPDEQRRLADALVLFDRLLD